ncbi:MAG: hypothetical protein K0R09_566 [Clostridiales bacterium]|jgi:hypothetical protein|nr:hypothetical protein [Clostridiales bacterium]
MTNKKVLFRTLKGGESIENKKFFTSCEGLTLSKRTELRRTSFALQRNDVATMEEVCLLYEKEGEALQEESLQKMDMLPQNRENIIERDRSKDKL